MISNGALLQYIILQREFKTQNKQINTLIIFVKKKKKYNKINMLSIVHTRVTCNIFVKQDNGTWNIPV